MGTRKWAVRAGLGFEGQSYSREGVCLTPCASTLSCLCRTAGVCPPRAVCFASVYTCVSVSMCSLAPSVSGIPSPEHTLWFYYRSMFAVKLLHRLARTCPAQGRELENQCWRFGKGWEGTIFTPGSPDPWLPKWQQAGQGRQRAGPQAMVGYAQAQVPLPLAP